MEAWWVLTQVYAESCRTSVPGLSERKCQSVQLYWRARFCDGDSSCVMHQVL